MKQYVLNCPNAITNSKKGLNISTQFSYNTRTEAEEHKTLCDAWAKDQGEEKHAYIEEVDQ